MTRESFAEIHRAWIIDAMVDVVREKGWAEASVRTVCLRAGLSRHIFYELFDSREDCFLAVLDDGYRQLSVVIAAALEEAEGWQEAARTALCASLSFFDARPGLLRVWLIESLSAGAWALERRERNIEALTRVIAERYPTRLAPHPLASAGAVAGVIGILQTHLLAADPEPLITLLSPLTGLLAAPHLDAHAVAMEMRWAEAVTQRAVEEYRSARQPAPAPPAVLIPAALLGRRSHRARRCLKYLAAHPNASNRQIADGIGVARHEQMSKLLARLSGMGLLAKRAGAPGHPNSWTLTQLGSQIFGALAAEPSRLMAARVSSAEITADPPRGTLTKRHG
jgi:TetR/AcrR family transcriptional regulator